MHPPAAAFKEEAEKDLNRRRRGRCFFRDHLANEHREEVQLHETRTSLKVS
jgi:hypothetical protein